MWRQEFAEVGPGRRVTEAANQLAFMINDADPRPEVGDVAADGGGRTAFAYIADRRVTLGHVQAARAVHVLTLPLVPAVTIEHLDPVVLSVGDIDPTIGVAAEVVDDIELALASAGLAP